MAETSLTHAREWLEHLERVTQTRAPQVAFGTCRDGELASYSAKTRTILVSGWLDRRQLIDTLTHEYQHHLDAIVGQALGGQKHGRHDSSFYVRLDELRIEAGLMPLIPPPG